MLSDNGLSNTEIAKLLGKSPQAVGQVLGAESTAKKKATKKSVEDTEVSKEIEL